MKAELNRELIESLNESSNENFAETLNNTVYGVVYQSLEQLCEKSPLVKMEKCVFTPVDEIFLGSFCQRSQYNYFLGVDNPQIAYNSKKARNWWAYVWKTFKESWRIGRKKKKKRKVVEKNEEIKAISVDKYNINDFKRDLFNRIANNISQTSMVYDYSDHISLVGNDDFGFGVKVNIFVCYYDSKTEVFKMFRESRNNFVDYAFKNRFKNLEDKVSRCGKSFVDMAKLINSIYSKTYNVIPNQVIVESLLFSCPDLLFDNDDVYKTFVNIANYIRMMSINSFVSICDENLPLGKEKLISLTNSQADYSRIVSMLDKYKY